MDTSHYRLFVQRIGLTGITNVLTTLSSLLIVIVLTKRLSIEEFGVYSLITVTVGLLPWVMTLGLSYTIVRFFAGAKHPSDIQEGFYSCLAIVSLANAALAAVLFVFARVIAASLFNGDLFPALCVPVIFFSASLNILFLAYFRLFERMKTWSAVSLVQYYGTLALVSAFVVAGFGLPGAIFGLLVGYLSSSVLRAGLIIRDIGLAVPRFHHTREYLAFGLPLVPQNFSSWVVQASDRYLIGFFLGTAAVGYYSPGYSLGSLISTFAMPLAVMLPPTLTKYYENDNLDAVGTVLRYAWKYYFGLAIPCVVGISVLSKPLLQIFTTPDIAANGYFITPFVAAGSLLLGAYEVIILAIILKKKTTISGTIWIASAALNFGVNLVLIPFLGTIGAAITTLAAYSLAFSLTAVYSLRYFTFEIDGKFLLKSVCASLIVGVFLAIIQPTTLPSVLLLVGLSAGIYLFILIMLKGFTREELKFFRGFFSRLV